MVDAILSLLLTTLVSIIKLGDISVTLFGFIFVYFMIIYFKFYVGKYICVCERLALLNMAIM